MTGPWHVTDGPLRVRKQCVGPLENNVYVVASAVTRRAVIVDAAAEADRILPAAAGFDVIAVLTTHGHHDHVGAAAEVCSALGVPFRIHPADAAMAGREPDVPLLDGDRIDLGDVVLEARHTPGHTPGSTCLLTGCFLFSGDTLFPGGPGATAGPGADFATVMESLRSRLFSLPDDTVVLPGHGLDTTIGAERPFLDEWDRRGY
jgi:glyoxylase-like metal-dependent hydrolase (beta-lactamase superfamily II)